MKQNKMRSLDHPSPMLVPLPTVAPLAQPWSVPSHSFTPPSKAWRPRHAPEKKGGDVESEWLDRGQRGEEVRVQGTERAARMGVVGLSLLSHNGEGGLGWVVKGMPKSR